MLKNKYELERTPMICTTFRTNLIFGMIELIQTLLGFLFLESESSRVIQISIEWIFLIP